MALPTLADMITRKKGTGLFQTGPEETQSLAAKLGVQTPTSPLLAQGIGANPDQTKMIGSSANINKVITEAVSPDKDLATSMKRQQERQAKTWEEMQKQQQATSLANLQSLGSRLSTLVVQSLGAGQGSVTPTADTTKLSAILTDQAQLPEAESLTNKALSGTASQEELARLAPMIGLSPSASAEQIAQKIESLKADSAASIGGAAGAATSDTVTLSQLKPEDMAAIGITSLGELDGLLGLSAGEASQMTVKQLQDRVAALGRENFSQVKQLQDVANDPNRSQPERDEAIRRLRELGSAGVRATEQDYAKLNQEVQGASQVSFMGETHSIQDILSDEFLSSAVKAYLEDPNYARQLKAESPSLASFIDGNRAALEAASKALGEDVAQLAQTQAANASLGNPGGIPVDAAVNEAIFGPNWNGGFSSAPLEKSNFHRLMEDKSLSEAFRVSYSSLVGDLAKASPDMARQFAGLTVQQLSDAGLTTPEALANYKEYLDTVQTLQSAPTDEMAIEAAVGSLDELNDVLAQARAIEMSGLSEVAIESPLLDALDPDGNGIIDNPAEVRARLQQLSPALTPQDMAGRRPLLDPKDLLNKVKDQLTAGNFGLYDKIRGYMDDGGVDAGEARELVNSPATLDELIRISKSIRVGPEASSVIVGSLQSKADKQAFDDVLGLAGQPINLVELSTRVQTNKASPTEVDQLNTLKDILSKKRDEATNEYSRKAYSTLLQQLQGDSGSIQRYRDEQKSKEEAGAQAAKKAVTKAGRRF